MAADMAAVITFGQLVAVILGVGGIALALAIVGLARAKREEHED